MNKSIPIYTNRGRFAGQVKNSVFYKTIKKHHVLKRPPALCMDSSVLSQIKELGATMIQVTQEEPKKVWRLPIPRYEKKGFKINRGHGSQVCVCLKNWGTSPAREQLSLAVR